jgi:large subunit ribosomal protein L39e|eukprot:COSAG01_NODE_13_length_41723_cov_145.394556_32_plen_66_part_00
MPSHKTFRVKKILAKKQKQNRQVPQWIRFRTGNTVRPSPPAAEGAVVRAVISGSGAEGAPSTGRC